MWVFSTLKSFAVHTDLNKRTHSNIIFRYRTIRGVGRYPYPADHWQPEGPGYIKQVGGQALVCGYREFAASDSAQDMLRRGVLLSFLSSRCTARAQRSSYPSRPLRAHSWHRHGAAGRPCRRRRPSRWEQVIYGKVLSSSLNIGSFLLVGFTFAARQLTPRMMDKIAGRETSRGRGDCGANWYMALQRQAPRSPSRPWDKGYGD